MLREHKIFARPRGATICRSPRHRPRQRSLSSRDQLRFHQSRRRLVRLPICSCFLFFIHSLCSDGTVATCDGITFSEFKLIRPFRWTESWGRNFRWSVRVELCSFLTRSSKVYIDPAPYISLFYDRFLGVIIHRLIASANKRHQCTRNFINPVM